MTSSQSASRPRFYRTGEVARILDVSPMTVVNYCNRGALATVRSGSGYRRISHDALTDYMRKNSIPLEHLDRIEPPCVLIAHPSPAVRAALRRLLEGLAPQSTIAEASDAYAACVQAGQLAPHAVVLEPGLPGFRGAHLKATFREVRRTRSTKVLAVADLGRIVSSQPELAPTLADEILDALTTRKTAGRKLISREP